MKCSAFIATSIDGFIATKDGSVEWLHTSGNSDADMGEHTDMGFNSFMTSVDCIIMGRKCMEVISNMNLTPEQWPYGKTKIIALSNTLKEAPDNLKGKVEMCSGDLNELISRLEKEGFKHAYIDGGKTIQAFIQLQLLEALTITRAPIILGEGIPLFGSSNKNIELQEAKAVDYPNGFVQVNYKIKY